MSRTDLVVRLARQDSYLIIRCTQCLFSLLQIPKNSQGPFPLSSLWFRKSVFRSGITDRRNIQPRRTFSAFFLAVCSLSRSIMTFFLSCAAANCSSVFCTASGYMRGSKRATFSNKFRSRQAPPRDAYLTHRACVFELDDLAHSSHLFRISERFDLGPVVQREVGRLLVHELSRSIKRD